MRTELYFTQTVTAGIRGSKKQTPPLQREAAGVSAAASVVIVLLDHLCRGLLRTD